MAFNASIIRFGFCLIPDNFKIPLYKRNGMRYMDDYPYFGNEPSKAVLRRKIGTIKSKIKYLQSKELGATKTEWNKIRDKVHYLNERLKDLEYFYRRLSLLEYIARLPRELPGYGVDPNWSVLQ